MSTEPRVARRRSLSERVSVSSAIILLLGHVAVGGLTTIGGIYALPGDYNYPENDPAAMKGAIATWVAIVAIGAALRAQVDRRAAGAAFILASVVAIASQTELGIAAAVLFFDLPLLIAGVGLLRSRDVVFVPGLRSAAAAIGVVAGLLSLFVGWEAVDAGRRGLAIDPWTVTAGIVMFALGLVIASLSRFQRVAGRATPLLLAGGAVIGLAVGREHYTSQAVMTLLTALACLRADAASRRPFLNPPSPDDLRAETAA